MSENVQVDKLDIGERFKIWKEDDFTKIFFQYIIDGREGFIEQLQILDTFQNTQQDKLLLLGSLTGSIRLLDRILKTKGEDIEFFYKGRGEK